MDLTRGQRDGGLKLKEAWHGYYNVHFDMQSKQVAFDDLDKRDQQELVRVSKRNTAISSVVSRDEHKQATEPFSKTQPAAYYTRGKPFKPSIKPSLGRDCGSERNIKPAMRLDERSMGSAAMVGKVRVRLSEGRPSLLHRRSPSRNPETTSR